jgi:peptidoglycan/xylan/chitin deacetylase (PgdA/CDA1 family)
MYHQVGPHRGGSPLDKWRVTEVEFGRHLDLLSRRGYRGIALRDLLADPGSEGSRHRRVVLTFDDGFDGVRTRALPLLARHGFGATVFAVAGKPGGTNDWDAEEPGDRLLDEAGLRELAGAGIEIGSHGLTHRALPGLADDELRKETTGSRERLQQAIGQAVETFCYPYGAFDDRSVEAVRAAGYRAATVIRSGIPADLSDPFRLRRVPVRGTDPLLDLSLALTRGRSKF